MDTRVIADVTTVSGSILSGEIILHPGETLFEVFSGKRSYVEWASFNEPRMRLPKSIIRNVRLLKKACEHQD